MHQKDNYRCNKIRSLMLHPKSVAEMIQGKWKADKVFT
jgi:hypothetical protein